MYKSRMKADNTAAMSSQFQFFSKLLGHSSGQLDRSPVRRLGFLLKR